MSEYNMTRNALADMPSGQLSAMLRLETEKEMPDDGLVLEILHILESRRAGEPVELGPKSQKAWETYQEKVRRRAYPYGAGWGRVLRAASIVLVIGCLALLLPQQAQADNFWEKLTRWTDSIFEYFNPHRDEAVQEVYEFRTDNPGLQQVYDAVAALGVTEPVVPMWLPEGYELVECNTTETPLKKTVFARFFNNNEIIFELCFYDTTYSKKYLKDKTITDIKEIFGTTHNIIRNNEMWAVSWTRDNIECAFSIDCQEDTLDEILTSIYRWRATE